MKFVDEFRNPDKAKTLISNIESLVAKLDVSEKQPLQLM